MIIPNVVTLAAQGVVLSWILKMEQACSCSERWQRDYMKWYAMATILLAVVAIAGFRVKNPVLAGAAVGAGLVNIYAILTYIPKMTTVGCKCATEKDWRDDFIYWWTIVGVAAAIFAALTLFSKM
jgi:hypothetical protein